LKNYPKTIDRCFFQKKTNEKNALASNCSARNLGIAIDESFFRVKSTIWALMNGMNCLLLLLNFSDSSFPITGALIKSQFPVFTIYAQKTCLKKQPCERPWTVDRVQGYALKNHIKRSSTAASRQECYEMCFAETDFLCR
jgi:hypothetical protein